MKEVDKRLAYIYMFLDNPKSNIFITVHHAYLRSFP